MSHVTADEFLILINNLASGEMPSLLGRLLTIPQWRVCDKIAGYWESLRDDDQEMWREYRDIVLRTRLTPMDRNKVIANKEW